MKRKHRNQVVKPKSRQWEIWRKYDPNFLEMQMFQLGMIDLRIALDECVNKRTIHTII